MNTPLPRPLWGIVLPNADATQGYEYRYDFTETDVEDPQDEYYDTQDMLRELGWELADAQIEHDCISGDLVRVELEPANGMDELCQRMLQLGAFADGTQHMQASEIRALLVPFFGQERIDQAVKVICGEV